MPTRSRAVAAVLTISAVLLAVPTAAQDDPSTEAPSTGPSVAQFMSDDGVELGTITILAVTDPYVDFEPTRPPADGERYVVVDVSWEAAPDQQFPIDPRQLQLRDANGVLYTTSTVPRPADSLLPELSRQALAPFSRLIGVTGYVVPEDVSLSSIVYRGDAGDRGITVAEPAPAETAAIGEETAITDAAGAGIGSVTVRAVEDPFTDFAEARPPADGTHYVLVHAAFGAADDGSYVADPRALLLIDTLGRIHRPATVTRKPDELVRTLEIQPLSPGDLVSGMVGYVVPDGTVLAEVVWAPAADRLVPVSDL